MLVGFELDKYKLLPMQVQSSSGLLVEDKICTGTECKEIKSSTSDKEDGQVDKKGTVPSTTSGTD